jgi:hypothetical protein
MDRQVGSEADSANAHLTENGYIRHRLLEMEARQPATQSRLLFGPITNVA